MSGLFVGRNKFEFVKQLELDYSQGLKKFNNPMIIAFEDDQPLCQILVLHSHRNYP
jgi:hypothetical protein